MKKLLTKIRIWLIRKLGGFVEQEYKEIVMKTIPLRPERICYETKVENYRTSNPEYQEFLLRNAAIELGTEIIKRHLYIKSISNYFGDDFTHFRFDIQVLMPDICRELQVPDTLWERAY